MKRIFGSYQTLLPIVYLQLILVSVFPACSQTSASSSIPKYHPRVSDFQLAGDQIIPEVDSSNRLVFSGSSSAVPAESGVDRFTAPPIAVVMEQKIAVRDARTGAELFDGKPLNGFHEFVKRSGTWEPGSWTAYVEGSSFSDQQSHERRPVALERIEVDRLR